MKFHLITFLAITSSTILLSCGNSGKTEYSLKGLDEIKAVVLSELPLGAAAAGQGQSDNVPVRVIVSLNEKAVNASGSVFQPAFSVPLSDNILNQANDNISKTLSNLNAGRYEPIKGLPIATVETTLGKLKELENAQVFSSVIIDEKHRPTLAESHVTMNVGPVHINGATGNGTTVAVLDTGVQIDHPFFNGRVVDGACYSTNYGTTRSTCPGRVTESITLQSGGNCDQGTRGCDHGTHVAGIIAGKSNDSVGYSGIAPDSNIMSIQVFSEETDESTCKRYFGNSATAPCSLSYTSDQIKALARVKERAGALNIVAVNMSLGGNKYKATCDTTTWGSVDERKTMMDSLLQDNGVVTIVASANAGYLDGIGAPACISSAIAVGSTDDPEGAGSTEYVANYSNISPEIDILATGSTINSAVLNSAYGNKSGTSMAAPQVAGAIAALKSAYPNKSSSEIVQILKSTGMSITERKWYNKATGQTEIIPLPSSLPRMDLNAAYANVSVTSPILPTPNNTLAERVTELERKVQALEQNQ